MINKQLIDFVSSQNKIGTNKEVVKNQLLSNGWTNRDIEEAYDNLAASVSSTQKNNTSVNNSSNSVENNSDENSTLKNVTIVFAVIAFALALFIVYKEFIQTDSNKVKDVSYLGQEEVQKTNKDTEVFKQEQIEESASSDQKKEQSLPETKEETKVVAKTEPTKIVEKKITPINCGKDMSCFINAAKNCTPSYVEEIKTVDIFGMVQTNRMKSTLSGFDASKKCMHSSLVVSADLSYSPEMKEFILSKIKEEGTVLTEAEKVEATQISNEALDSVKSTVGMNTKCSFTTSYLVELLTKWEKGDWSSSDMDPGNCKTTDSTGKDVLTF